MARTEFQELMVSLTPKAQDILFRIFARDPKCGVQTSTVNKVWPGLIALFEAMLAEPGDDPRAQKIDISGRQASLKMDGKRMIAIQKNGIVDFRSREGRPVYGMDEAGAEILKLGLPEGTVLDGEIYDTDWNSTQSITASSVNTKASATWKFYVFEYLTSEEWNGHCTSTFRERDERLATILKDGTRVMRMPDLGVVESRVHLKTIFDKALAMGFEGLVLKDMDAPYVKDRSLFWIKAKDTETIDGKIIDFFPGKPGTKYEKVLGGFVVQLDNGDVVRVGGGLKDNERTDFWNRKGELLGMYLEYLQDRVPDRAKMKARFPRFTISSSFPGYGPNNTSVPNTAFLIQ